MKKVIFLFLIFFVVVFLVRFVLGGNEDSWICENGAWVRHGNPSLAMPKEPCGEQMVGNDRDEHGCIGSAGYLWCGSLNKCIRPWEEECEGEVREKFPVTINSIKEETRLYKITVENPTFGEAVLDGVITADVNKMIADFKKQSEDNWNERKQNDSTAGEYPESPFDLIISWAHQQMNKDYVSVKLNEDYYTGGANFAQEIKTYNFDMKNKKWVALADLMKNDPNYLTKVSDYARKDLESQGLEGIFEEGLAPSEDNFKNFTFDDNAITFYFPKYQVAPGAMGEQKVVMGRGQ